MGLMFGVILPERLLTGSEPESGFEETPTRFPHSRTNAAMCMCMLWIEISRYPT
jgi:hypothetical protein